MSEEVEQPTIYEILADDDKVLEASTSEWQESMQAEIDDPTPIAHCVDGGLVWKTDESAGQMEHLEYVQFQMKEDGIRDSDDALSLAFYMRAAELLAGAE